MDIFRGYYPKGGGHVRFMVNPVINHVKPLELLNSGEIVEIKGKSFVAGVLPIKVRFLFFLPLLQNISFHIVILAQLSSF